MADDFKRNEVLDKMNETVLISRVWMDMVSMCNSSNFKMSYYDDTTTSLDRTKRFQIALPNHNCFCIDEHLYVQMRHWIFAVHFSASLKKVMRTFSEFVFLRFWESPSDFRDDYTRSLLSRENNYW